MPEDCEDQGKSRATDRVTSMIEMQNVVWIPFGKFRRSYTDPRTGKLVIHPDANPSRRIVGNYNGYLLSCLPVDGEPARFKHVVRYSFAIPAFFGNRWRSNWGDFRRCLSFYYRRKKFTGVYYESTGFAVVREAISEPERDLLIPLRRLKAKCGNIGAAYLASEPVAVRGVNSIRHMMRYYDTQIAHLCVGEERPPEYHSLLRYVLHEAEKEISGGNGSPN